MRVGKLPASRAEDRSYVYDTRKTFKIDDYNSVVDEILAFGIHPKFAQRVTEKDFRA